VRQIHAENVAAGAAILTANTFRTHARNGFGERAASATALAVRLAREAALGSQRTVWVAGSLSPLEDCYTPDLVPEGEDLEREHGLQSEALAGAGCDLVLVETMNTLREARAALRAATATGLPVVVSLVSDGQGHLLSGEPLAIVAATLLDERIPPVALGLNCVPARRLARDLEVLARARPVLSWPPATRDARATRPAALRRAHRTRGVRPRGRSVDPPRRTHRGWLLRDLGPPRGGPRRPRHGK
jgi:methionine synthase I (cobalamin-dependent)